MPKKEQVNLYLEMEVDRRLEEIARRTRRSKGAMVSVLIDHAYDRMMRYDQARQSLTRRTQKASEKPEVS